MELGDPISYMTLDAGVPVFSRDVTASARSSTCSPTPA